MIVLHAWQITAEQAGGQIRGRPRTSEEQLSGLSIREQFSLADVPKRTVRVAARNGKLLEVAHGLFTGIQPSAQSRFRGLETGHEQNLIKP